MSDLREPMRIKVCKISFQKYSKKLQVTGLRRRKDLYFDHIFPWTFLLHPACMKRMLYNVLTPDVFLNHPFLEDE